MERGIEQYFVLAAIIVAALLDLLVRFARRKTGGTLPPEMDSDDSVFDDEEAYELRQQRRMEVERQREIELRRMQVEYELERARELERTRAEMKLPDRAPPMRVPPREQPKAIAPTSPARIAPVVPPPRVARPSIAAPSRRRTHTRQLLLRPDDARHGVILMTILGPCRALEDQAERR